MDSVKNLSTKLAFRMRRKFLIFFVICLILTVPIYFGGIYFYGIVYDFRHPRRSIVVPRTTEVKEYSVSESEVVNLSNGEKELYVKVSNSENTEYGFWPWVYNYQILDFESKVIDEGEVSSYLLPRELKYVSVRSKNPRGVQLKITPNQATKSMEADQDDFLEQEELKITNLVTTFEEISGSSDLLLTMSFRNDDFVKISELDIVYILRDSKQDIVGINTTKLSNFLPGEERTIRIKYPKPQSSKPKILETRWSINYLDENAVSI
jgi:hypothetical protein